MQKDGPCTKYEIQCSDQPAQPQSNQSFFASLDDGELSLNIRKRTSGHLL